MTQKAQSGDDQPAPQSGRVMPRRRQLKGAKLIFNDGNSIVDCRVRDISESGAGIECNGTAHIPQHVVLEISNGAVYQAAVVRKTESMLGLKFEANSDAERLLAELSRLRAGLSMPLEGMLSIAEECAQADYGHPRVKTLLSKVSSNGRRFMESYDKLIANNDRDHS
jgi:hypothetical protein